jgi:hypothetical protein
MQKLPTVEGNGRMSHLFQVPFLYCIQESKENHGIIHTEYLITQPTFEQETFRICNYINPSFLAREYNKNKQGMGNVG